MEIFGKDLSVAQPPLFVAEMSCNHVGSKKNAINLIQYAKEAEADAIKIQVYHPSEMTIKSTRDDFKIKEGLWKGKYYYDLYEKNQTKFEWLPDLFSAAEDWDIPLFASVFGPKGLEACEKLGCPAYKIASFEANDPYFMEMVRLTKKPCIVSTGTLSDSEIDNIINVFGGAAVLMHCISKYPTKEEECNMGRIGFLHEYGNFVGWSDHTTGYTASEIATALDVDIIERHLKLYNASGSDDDAFSLTPEQFKESKHRCAEIYKMMYHGGKVKQDTEHRRSLYVVEDINKGEEFNTDNVRSIRPGFGLPPEDFGEVFGRRAAKDIKKGTALSWLLVE